MDPNQALSDAVDAARKIYNGDIPPSSDDIETLLDRFMALDEWLCKGGFIPDRWNPDKF